MFRSLGGHFRGNVVGYIALFFALSLGTAWAATELDKNDVKSKQIKNGAVKTKDLANDSVTSPKIDDGSLLSQDFASGQLPQGPQGPAGPQGQQGPVGPEGPRGSAGDPGTALAFARVNADGTLDAANSKNVAGVSPSVDGQGSAIAGGYCFELAFTPRSVIATAQEQGPGPQSLFASTTIGVPPGGGGAGLGGFCNGPDVDVDAYVRIRQASNGSGVDAPFFVLFN